MRLRDKCRRQKKEINKLWKHVSFPKEIRRKGDMIIITKAYSLSQLRLARDRDEIIFHELKALFCKLKDFIDN